MWRSRNDLGLGVVEGWNREEGLDVRGPEAWMRTCPSKGIPERLPLRILRRADPRRTQKWKDRYRARPARDPEGLSPD
jgi:hypothetical protein